MKKKTLLVSALSVFLLALSACELTVPNSSQAPAPESSSAEQSQTSSEASASQSAESSSGEASSSDSGPSSSQESVVAVTSVTLNKTELALKVDDTETLTATVLPANATDKTVTWSVDHVDIASISNAGLVTAKAVGTAVVKARAGDKEATCTVTVSAKEEPPAVEKVTVSFNANGGAGEKNSVEVDKGSEYTLPAGTEFTRDGYHLIGWLLNEETANREVGSKITVSADATLKANWEADEPEPPVVTKCTVSFNANGGTGTKTSVEVDKDSEYTLPAGTEFSRDGYHLIGWLLNEETANREVGSKITVSTDVILKVNWEVDTPVVQDHYYVVGTIGGADKWAATDYELTENPGKAGEYYLTELINLKDGDGIKVMNSNGGVYYPGGMGNEKPVTEDGKYQIYFEPVGGHDGWYEGYFNLEKYVPTLYTVSFLKGDEGASGEMEADHVEAGEYTLPANGFTAPSGKQFKAWQVGGNQYQPGTIINIEGATEVTAVWQVIPVSKFTVTYRNNDGIEDDVVVPNISGSYQLANNTFEAPANKAFKCWSINSENHFAGSYIDVEANVLAEAVWEDEYTIQFAANGGSGSMTDVKHVAGTYELPACGFGAPESHQFAGWKIGSEETIRPVGYEYTVSGNVTITAQWQEIAPEKSIWLGRGEVWSKAADLVINTGKPEELMALNVELQEGDKFVVRVLGDNYIKTISAGGAIGYFIFDGTSDIVVDEGGTGTYNFYVYESLTKLSIERVPSITGIKAYYNNTYHDDSNQFVFVGETAKTSGGVAIKYVKDDMSETEISSEEYASVKYYTNEACTELADMEYVYTEANRGEVTLYAKLGDYKAPFAFSVIYRNYVLHQDGEKWVETPLTEDLFEHKCAIIHLEEGEKFSVRTLGTWTSGLVGDFSIKHDYTEDGDLQRDHLSSIWGGTTDVTKVVGVPYDVAWVTTVTGDYVIGVHEDTSYRGVIAYRTNWTVTLTRASDTEHPEVLTPDNTLISEYQFLRLNLEEGDVLTLQRGDVKYGYNYYYTGSTLYLKFSMFGATEYFAGYDGTDSFVVKDGCSGVYSFYLKPQMIYYSIPSYPNSREYNAEFYIVKEDLWYYKKGTADPVEMSYDPYDSSNSVILANVDLEEGDILGFGNAILENVGYTNIANNDQKAHFTAGDNNKLVVKEGHAGAYTFHIVRSTGAITVDYTSVEDQGEFVRGTNYIVGSADFHTGTSVAGESWEDVAKAFTMIHDNTGKPDNCDDQYKATVKFNQNDQWKIRTNVYWPYIVENAGALEDNVYMEIVDGKIKVNRTGTYDIYLKTKDDGYWTLYISKAVDFTPDKSSVSIAVGGTDNVYVSYATEAEFETLTAVSADTEVATVSVNKAIKKITITGTGSGDTTVTISDGKTSVVIDVNVYGTYNVTFEMNLTEPKGWPYTSNFSLYVFGTGKYEPRTWDEVANNINSGSVTFTIPEGKDITGAVFYFNQVENEELQLKKSTDIVTSINSAGTYIVNFVNHWGKYKEDDKDVYKLDQITIVEKALLINKTSVSVEKGDSDSTVIATNAMGPLTVVSNHASIASASINTETGVVTINGVNTGEAVITISDGKTERTVDVTVNAPATKFTVTYQPNGGTGDAIVENNILGTYNLKDTNPFTAPSGKWFKAWKINTTEYALGAEVTISANTTVQAVWEDVPATTYYLVGIIGGNDDWSKTTHPFVATSTKGEYVLPSTITLNKGDQLKVHSSADEWFPGGYNKVVTTPGTYQIHLFPAGGTGDHDWSKDNYFYLELVEASEPAANYVTLYFTDNYEFGDVYAHYWKDGGAATTTWPGEKLISVGTNGSSQNVYAVTIDLNTYDRVIFNNNSNKQTVGIDISSKSTGDAFYVSGGSDNNLTVETWPF